uniref:Uncharacterized protein n=1 Tax=Kwoniella bestiolae CBS 10118 TaxID=1296100 RepID=A0A1B9GBL4_9TREE|nr:hypothetical protein I302_03268 [Kwoniella bestiolae CBS 10118]OCF28409.1 hypothetical protein I302_03268 [Kwoniella bestiolae CBS 10118]
MWPSSWLGKLEILCAGYVMFGVTAGALVSAPTMQYECKGGLSGVSSSVAEHGFPRGINGATWGAQSAEQDQYNQQHDSTYVTPTNEDGSHAGAGSLYVQGVPREQDSEINEYNIPEKFRSESYAQNSTHPN